MADADEPVENAKLSPWATSPLGEDAVRRLVRDKDRAFALFLTLCGGVFCVYFATLFATPAVVDGVLGLAVLAFVGALGAATVGIVTHVHLTNHGWVRDAPGPPWKVVPPRSLARRPRERAMIFGFASLLLAGPALTGAAIGLHPTSAVVEKARLETCTGSKCQSRIEVTYVSHGERVVALLPWLMPAHRGDVVVHRPGSPQVVTSLVVWRLTPVFMLALLASSLRAGLDARAVRQNLDGHRKRFENLCPGVPVVAVERHDSSSAGMGRTALTVRFSDGSQADYLSTPAFRAALIERLHRDGVPDSVIRRGRA